MRYCTHRGCVNRVFGTDKNTGLGYCEWHRWDRTDRKPKKSTPRFSERKKFHELNFGFDNQTDMFMSLWDNTQDKNGAVTCPYTGERLNRFYNTETWYNCFAHILPKGKYTYWKLNPINIEIVNPEFHKIIDQGTLRARAGHPEWKWEEWDKKVILMKEEYVKFKKENLLP